MLYVKNVPAAERAIRILMGVGLFALALLWLGTNARGWIVGAMALTAVVTCLIGWCPLCAMIGRKPKADH